MKELLTLKKERHETLMKTLYNEKYEQIEISGKGSFTWDGPSNWEKLYSQPVRILFLLKEARGEYEPCVPNQKYSNHFGENIALWSYTIQKFFEDGNGIVDFPNVPVLPNTNDHIAIVEVKKLNEEKPTSNNKEIFAYAEADAPFLREQIEIINPHVILCGNTLDCYDAIFDGHHVHEEERLYDDEKCSAWKSNNRLVLEFYHPSCSTFGNLSQQKLFEYLVNILINCKESGMRPFDFTN